MAGHFHSMKAVTYEEILLVKMYDLSEKFTEAEGSPEIQYNIILLKKLSGRSLTRIKLHVVVTSDQ